MKQIEMQDLTIPPIAIGTWAWGKGPFGSKFIFGVSHGIEELKPIYHYAVKNGLTLFDTAPVYSLGSSEKIIGDLTVKIFLFQLSLCRHLGCRVNQCLGHLILV